MGTPRGAARRRGDRDRAPPHRVCEDALASLDPPDRAAVEEAIELLRKGRASLDTTFPAQFRGVVAQSAPALFPAVAAEARRTR